jgi:predicted dehydrogenase
MAGRIGIAGYGVVGKRRHECVRRSADLDVVAVSDITFSGTGELEPGVQYCSDFRDLLEVEMDALLVCLPNDAAPAATIMGLENGLHVFCEKPPGRSVEDVLEVRSVEATHPDLVLKYGFNHRYHESVKEAKALIDSGRFGRILNLRGVYGKSRMIPFAGGWRSQRAVAGGGILLDQGIHMLDMIRFFAGDFDEVKSFVSSDFWSHDVEDNAWALLRNTSTGCVAMLHSTATQWRHKFRLEITLEHAAIELTGILSGSKSYGEEKLTVVHRDGASMNGSFEDRTTMFLEDNSWQEEVDEFAEAIVNDGPIQGDSSADALAVMELVYRIYCADHDWRERYSLEPEPQRPDDDEPT